MTNKSYATLISWDNFTQEEIDVLRELLSYDALCWRCNNLVQDEFGTLHWQLAPSPLHWSRQREWPICLLLGNPKDSEVCLEVGPGWGVFQYALSKRCKELYTLDASEDANSQVQNMRQKHGLGKNIIQTLGDGRRLPYESNKFDAVYCISTVEHIDPEREKVISECIRVLKPGGKFILTMDVSVGGESSTDDHHLDLQEAMKLLKDMGINSLKNTNTMISNVAGMLIVVMLVYFVK